MQSWLGASLDEVIRQWGFPDQEQKIAGRTVYIWRDDSHGLGDLANCFRKLQVNGKDVVVATDYSGNNCPFMEVGPFAKWRKLGKK